MFLNSDNYNNYLSLISNLIVKNILDKIDANLPIVKSRDKSPLTKSILEGQVKYTGFHFQGYFFKNVKEELEKLGAIKSTKGYYLSQSELPEYVKDALRSNKREVMEMQNKIANILLVFNTIIVFNNNYFTKLIEKMFFDLKIKDNYNLFFEKYKNNLQKGLKESISHISEDIKNKQFKTTNEVYQTTKRNLGYYLKERVNNTTNRFLYEQQVQHEKEKGRLFFYWFRIFRKTMRLSHDKYCRQCMQGTPIYFDNLPIENGERVYPRKLWNCRCGAFNDFTEFMRAVKNNHA